MNVSLYQAAAAMNAQARWQELISENLAAGSVPGYRKQDVSFSDVQAGLNPGVASANAAQYTIPAALASTNFREGEINPTGDPLNFAIEGPGFFEVQLPNGTHAYTRDGDFQINAQDQLVTRQGYLVMSDGGPVQFDPNSSSAITVSASGKISQGDQVRGKLRVVQFSQPSALTATPDGYFLADKPGMTPQPSTSSVRQGFLESANTSPSGQMADLITSLRMFEANQKVLQAQDERMRNVITDLGSPS